MTLLDIGVLACAVMWLLSVLLLIVLVVQEVAYWRRVDARSVSRVRVPSREVCDELGLRRERSRGVA